MDLFTASLPPAATLGTSGGRAKQSFWLVAEETSSNLLMTELL